MKLIVISCPNEIRDEVKIITELFESGLSTFHLRKPDHKVKDYQTCLKNIPEKYHDKIVIHSHYQLSEIYNVKGFHLPEKVRQNPVESDFENLKNYKIISTSFHSLESLNDNKDIYDYVFLSPVFDSISKINYFSAYNFKDVSNALSKIRFDVIALGGVNILNINQAYKMGFKGVALLGVVWKSNNPATAFSEIRDCCFEIEKEISFR
jgi:thiamine-phosphate pyrophosphorylase